MDPVECPFFQEMKNKFELTTPEGLREGDQRNNSVSRATTMEEKVGMLQARILEGRDEEQRVRDALREEIDASKKPCERIGRLQNYLGVLRRSLTEMEQLVAGFKENQ